MKNLKKIIAIAAGIAVLSGCGGDEINFSGTMEEFAAKNYTISLPEECSVIASEISDLSAVAGNCSVSVVSAPKSQSIICEDKKDFREKMDSLGYNLTVEDYEKKEIDGTDVYAAEYTLGESKITQLTYVIGEEAYTATYARPKNSSKEADKLFKKGLETLKIEETEE